LPQLIKLYFLIYYSFLYKQSIGAKHSVVNTGSVRYGRRSHLNKDWERNKRVRCFRISPI